MEVPEEMELLLLPMRQVQLSVLEVQLAIQPPTPFTPLLKMEYLRFSGLTQVVCTTFLMKTAVTR